MRIVVIESPYRSRSLTLLERNLAYARALVEHVTLRGDSPSASHLLITQSLDDRDMEHRKLGMAAGLALLRVADIHAFGIDLGVSDGMRTAMEIAKAPVVDVSKPTYEEISLPDWAHAAQLYEDLYRECGTSNPVCGSCICNAFSDLIDRYQPKWHVHEAK